MRESAELLAESAGMWLYRVDYGYPPPLPAGWEAGVELDLARLAIPPATSSVEVHPPSVLPWDGEGPIVLRNADRLLGWRRHRGLSRVMAHLVARGRLGSILLQCRFPRHSRELIRAIRAEGGSVVFDETPRDGSIPPLLRGIAPGNPLLKLHLELEWVSAIAQARGESALEQVGMLIARKGAASPMSVASAMGISVGAARSYLSWMADVALVRREGGRFDLAHPLLVQRFEERSAPLRPTAVLGRRDDDMSVD